MERIIKEHTFYDDYLNDEIILIDLGACMGEFTKGIDDEFKLKKSILVEAGPMNFSKLKEKNNYVLYNNVISSKSNEMYEFYEDPNSPYNGSIMFTGFDGIYHKIKSITLSDLFIENNITNVDIMKVDIEGAEYDLLLNTPKEIFDKINQITVEFHEFLDTKLTIETEKVMKRMESFGYKIITKKLHNFSNYDVLFYKNKI